MCIGWAYHRQVRLSILTTYDTSPPSDSKVFHSLHNVAEHSSLAPLIINLPAFPTRDVEDVASYLPRFLHHFPTVTIHYRWTERQGDLSTFPYQARASAPPQDPSEAISRYIATPLHWPTPFHDTMFGYEWVVRTLSPPKLRRRTVYVYGSYLGASLAPSLALTESHTHQPMAIRGLMAFNGIYNWSRMLPGHPTNRIILDDAAAAESSSSSSASPSDADDINKAPSDQDVAPLRDLTPALFRTPSNVFDPFASPVLFFHTAGMLVPKTFGRPRSYRDLGGGADDPSDLPYVYSDPEDPPPPAPYDEGETADADADDDPDFTPFSKWPPPPRKGYFAYPPRNSSLKVPETLLLHTPSTTSLAGAANPATGKKPGLARLRKLKNAENSFEAHAVGLAGLMRKSINRMELRERMKWDTDFSDWEGEAARRVGVADVGDLVRDGAGRIGESGLGEQGEDIAMRWLAERVGSSLAREPDPLTETDPV